VRLEVFDVSGRLIHVLVDGVQVSGSHQVMWDGTNRAGRPVASGLYLSRLRVGKHTAVNRMLLMK
jgi:flagellar hook assembly protein FlgD